MNQLTIMEREELYEEIHGVEQIIEESDEFVQKKLEEMDFELNHKIVHNPAYVRAMMLHANDEKKGDEEGRPGDRFPHHVTNRKFRIMFLRSEKFDAPKAARRLVRFLEGKLQYLGELYNNNNNDASSSRPPMNSKNYDDSILTRQLLFTDLDSETQHFLETGAVQLLSCRDRAGRAIFGDFHLLRCIKTSVKSFVSFFFFLPVFTKKKRYFLLLLKTILYVFVSSKQRIYEWGIFLLNKTSE